MKIALLTDGIWPFIIGGMQKHSYYLCRYLARAGVQVHLYHTVKHAGVQPDLKAHFSEKEMAFITPFLVPYPTPASFPGHYIWDAYRYSRMVHQQLSLTAEKYDVIYMQGFSGWYTLNRKRAGENLPLCVLNFHGLEMFQRSASLKNKLEQAMFRPFVRKILKKADIVQSLGGRLTDIILKNGVPGERIMEMGIGIEEAWVKEAPSPATLKRVFTFVGRYERRKGVEELSAAIGKLLPLSDCAFHFIGPVPSDKQVEAEGVFYHGTLNTADAVKEILDTSDFLVLPSYAEGMPTVILEAMSRGCAIIAADVGAVNEQVSGSNGILVPEPSVDELVKALTQAGTMSATRLDAMKRASVGIIKERFLWEPLVDNMIKRFRLAKSAENEN